MLEIHMTLCVRELDFPEKNFLPQKLGKWPTIGQKQGLFNILKNLTEFVL